MGTIRERFERDGYYHAAGLYAPGEIAPMEREYDRIVEQIERIGEPINARWPGPMMEGLEPGQTTVLHTHNVQQYSAVWMRALLCDRFLDVAEALLGPDIVLHHTKLFCKPAGEGAPFPIHQDWSYFPTVKDTMIAGVIHLSEATDEMGCFRVYPGSHKLGRREGTDGREASELLDQYPLDTATPLEARPGDVLFFHYFLLHGSPPNRSPKTRKTVLTQLYAGDDRVEPGNRHHDERLALRGWNHHASRSTADGDFPNLL